MKNILFLLLIFTVFYGYSQDTKTKSRKEQIQDKLVLVVPFNPILYNNEASKEMIEQTGYKYKQVQNFLRMELDKNLLKAIADSCRSKGLLESYTTGGGDDLERIYAVSDYFLSDAMSYNPENKPLFGKSNVAADKDMDEKKEKKKKKEETAEKNTKGEVYSEVKNNPDKFLNIKFREKDFLKNFSKKDNVDFFLFINQFEIKGDYSDPYKVGNLSYAREIKIHFSVFNHNGKYLYGSYATIEFPATVNDPQKVADSYFLKLAREIVKNIPY
ncbi:MAG: hypothetical protein HY958_08570 [Bacteroidia bacterium]|nr:hypothetical protein [Bacteroidia bacterium]